MKLYFSKGACSLACRIIINELQIPCEFIAVDLKTKRTQTGEDYFNINPKGVVPALLTDSDGVLTENAVILQYLADTHPQGELLPKLGNFERNHVLEWLNFIATELHKSVGTLFKPTLPPEIKDNYYLPLIKSKLNYVNHHLENHMYLYDDQFTLPDAYLLVILRWAHGYKIDLSTYKNIERYYRELNDRPAVVLSLKQEGLRL